MTSTLDELSKLQMGNLKSCEKCPSAVTGSVINLSDNLVTKLIEGQVEEDADEYEEPCDMLAQESRWIEKLKCIDNQHSMAYGLNMEGFDILYNKMMREVKVDNSGAVSITRDALCRCLERNKNCGGNCQPQIDAFKTAVEIERLETLHGKKVIF